MYAYSFFAVQYIYIIILSKLLITTQTEVIFMFNSRATIIV